MALLALQSGAARLLACPAPPDATLRTTVWGRVFDNPLGLAPGFDKNAEALDALGGLGFGFIEIGGVTPRPQTGNPKPRLFRLIEDRAIVNRMGFNSDGQDVVRSRFAAFRARNKAALVGVNLGKNKEQADAAADYVSGVRAFAALADFIVINISSPNTPGLRALQGVESLVALTRAVRAARDEAKSAVPLLFKIAPDLEITDITDICRVAVAEQMDGMVISNTTVARAPTLRSAHAAETGGLSGAPLFETSTQLLREVYALTEGKLPLVGVGGVGSAAQAYAKIRAGASLVQLYSAMVYEGPGLVGQITRGLADLVRRDGFASVTQAVGADHRK